MIQTAKPLTLVDTGFIAYKLAKYDDAWLSAYPTFHRAKAKLILDSPTSIRKQEFPEYKAQRNPHKDADYFAKVVALKQVIRDEIFLPTFELQDYEADDLIALFCYMSCHQKETGHQNNGQESSTQEIPLVKVFGIDKDLLMLPNIFLQDLNGKQATISNFASHCPKTIQHLITEPHDILKVLVSCGDIADNISSLSKGVKYLRWLADIWNVENFYHRLYQEFGDKTMVNIKLAMLPHYTMVEQELTLDFLDALWQNDAQLTIKDEFIKKLT